MCDCTIAIKKFNAPFNLQFQWNGKKPFWNFSRKILETLWTPNRSLLQHCPLELAEFEAHHLQTVVDSSDDVVSCRKISCFQSLQNCSAVMVIQFWFHNFFREITWSYTYIVKKTIICNSISKEEKMFLITCTSYNYSCYKWKALKK